MWEGLHARGGECTGCWLGDNWVTTNTHSPNAHPDLVAGDHVKFNFPMAWSTTTLIWGLLEYRDAWQKSGELQNGLDCVKWPLDYFIKCHPDENTYYVQVRWSGRRWVVCGRWNACIEGQSD